MCSQFTRVKTSPLPIDQCCVPDFPVKSDVVECNMTCHQVGFEVAPLMQDGDGVEPGSGEEDAGMYGEEQYAEQHEYPDDPAGLEGADVDADNDQQDSELQGSDMQTEAVHQDEDEFAGDFAEGGAAELDLGEEELAEADLAEGDLVEEDLLGAEGNDDDGNEAEAPTDEPVSAQSCLQPHLLS